MLNLNVKCLAECKPKASPQTPIWNQSCSDLNGVHSFRGLSICYLSKSATL